MDMDDYQDDFNEEDEDEIALEDDDLSNNDEKDVLYINILFFF